MNTLPLHQSGTIHEERVESIATGGAGVARLDGRAVFIPKTAAGDTVRFRVVKEKGKYLIGELEEIIRAGPARTAPPCAHWSDCGGCALQHVTPQAQAEAKKRIFLDALARIGKIDLRVPVQTVALPGNEERYRVRARFQIRGSGLGFFTPGARRLVEVEDCLLVEPSIANALGQARHLLQAEPRTRRIEAVEMTSLGEAEEAAVGLYLHAVGHRDRGNCKIDPRTLSAWKKFAEENRFPLATAGRRGPGGPPRWRAQYRPDMEHPELCLGVSPESFIQPNRALNRLLVKSVIEECRLNDEALVLDLYCGAGNFSLPLAVRSKRVLGVEENPYAVADAGLNREENGVENAEFLHSSVHKLTKEEVVSKLGGQKPGVVVLDPPRKGALDAMPLISALAPDRVVYVSCNPATLARDARELAASGYRARAAYVFDMFSHTAHLETLTSWTRKDASGPTQRF
ncbi:MAG: class I SAM-dependent RNA methyltransferase [Nitrospinae bacterium]|nr:class I SAM-dependent RNA methyltransferase [Nitrospinota bacterium]